MELHKVTLTNLSTGTQSEYLLNLSEDEEKALDELETLSEMYEMAYGDKWNIVASPA